MANTSQGSRSTSTAESICRALSTGSAGAGCKPRVDVRPCPLVGSAPCHDADVTTGNPVNLSVSTSDPRQDRLRLAWRGNVIALRNHVEEVCFESLQIHDLSADLEFSFHQAVVPVEIDYELSICAAGHRKDVCHPGVHGVPCFDHSRIIQAVPKLAVICYVVFYRFKRLGAIVDHLARHITESCENFIEVEVFLVGPSSKCEAFAI